jgi:ADP-heptose:LPS heptosyltransferase
MGDFVLAWPLAMAAGRLYPQSRIIFITHAQKGVLAEKALRVEWADIEGGWHRLFAGDPLPVPAARTLAGAHTIFSFLASPDDAWAREAIAVNPHLNLHTLRTQPPAEFTGHASEHLLSQLGSAPAVQKAVEQILRSIADRGLGIRPGNESTLIHPGSGSRDKCWPVGQFAALARQLQSAGHAVRFLIGEVERERFSSADLRLLMSAASVVEPQNLIELYRELTQARLLIGNDSGPSHLAGIMGLPTIALFGPTDPAIWKPLGPRVQVIRDEPIDRITVDQVLALAT